MAEDTVCTIGVYGGRQPSILVNNHLVYGRIPDPGTQPDIIADVPKNRLVANLNPASDGMTDNPRLPLEMFAAWLANGDVGFSSLAIVQRLTGITMTVNGTREHGCEDTPKDPGDLRRILGMFDMVPSARAYLSLMRDVSEDWKNIIDHWDELEKQYRKEEHNPSGCAPKTYRILKRLNMKSTPNGTASCLIICSSEPDCQSSPASKENTSPV